MGAILANRPWVAFRRFGRLSLGLAAAVLVLHGGRAGASEAVTNRFDLFVPVTLGVIEVSRAVGIVPAPLAACAAVRLPRVSGTVQAVLR